MSSRRDRDSESGYALVGVVLVLLAAGILSLGFLHMAGGETHLTQSDLESQRAFWLAEAGKERAIRWMTGLYRPPDFDVDPYTDEIGPSGGTYSVHVRVDTSAAFQAEKAFLVESIGRSRGRERRVLQRIVMESFAKYAYFTVDETSPGGQVIWFVSADRLEGRVHSNGVFHIHGSPTFVSHVTSAADHMVGNPGFNVYDPGGWPVGGNNPVFGDGFELNVAPIPLPSETLDLRDQALTDGLLLAQASDVELGKNEVGPANGWLRYRPTNPPGGPWTAVDISTLVSRVVYCDLDLQISGVLDGELTLAGQQDVIIVDDLTYLASDASGAPLPGCNDLLGVVAGQNIIFDYNPANAADLKVNAVLMALNTSIKSESHDQFAPRGILTIWGGLIQKYRGAVGTVNNGGVITHGYAKNYHYDPRVTARTPPAFPLTGVYRKDHWEETWVAVNPF